MVPAAYAAIHRHSSFETFIRQSRAEPQALVDAPAAHAHLIYGSLQTNNSNVALIPFHNHIAKNFGHETKEERKNLVTLHNVGSRFWREHDAFKRTVPRILKNQSIIINNGMAAK